MRIAPLILMALLLVAATPASPRALGPLTAAGCIDVQQPGITLTGRLSVKDFPGAPGFESIAAGDERERTYILTLPKPICIEDGDNFADPSVRFRTVHITTGNKQLWPRLRAALGRQVTVTGSGYAAETGHHHAPLVLWITRMRLAGS
jgi:hypothetical protein